MHAYANTHTHTMNSTKITIVKFSLYYVIFSLCNQYSYIYVQSNDIISNYLSMPSADLSHFFNMACSNLIVGNNIKGVWRINNRNSNYM